MKKCLTPALMAIALCQPGVAAASDGEDACEQLIALFIQLGQMSGETVTEAEARQEVLSEQPTQAECAAMLSMFEAQSQ